MSKQIRTIDELRESRILYDKKPPAFGYMIISSVVCILLVLLVWSIYTPKVYMISAQGTVTSENANYVMTAVSGTISKSNIKEGSLVEKGDVLLVIESTDYNLQIQQLEMNKEYYIRRAEQYRKLIRSIKDDINYFSAANGEDSLFYSIFEAYKAQIAQNQFDASAYKAYGYTDEQIEFEVEKNLAKLSEIYYTTIQSAENSVSESEMQIASIDSQLNALNIGKGNYEITAPSSGIVHMMTEYKVGMVVQGGNALAVVTPANECMIIDAYLSPADRVKINQGSTVEIALSGLVQSVYGTISGKVVHIDSNITTTDGNNGENNMFFKIKVQPDFEYLTSSAGEKIDLSAGMTAEIRIQYDKVTYFNYIIEKLGFKVD